MFNWPQIVMIVWMTVALVVSAILHGKPKGTWDVFSSSAGMAFLWFVLYSGGFFG